MPTFPERAFLHVIFVTVRWQLTLLPKTCLQSGISCDAILLFASKSHQCIFKNSLELTQCTFCARSPIEWKWWHPQTTGHLLHEGRHLAAATAGEADVPNQLHRDGPCDRRSPDLPAHKRTANQGRVTAVEKGKDASSNGCISLLCVCLMSSLLSSSSLFYFFRPVSIISSCQFTRLSCRRITPGATWLSLREGEWKSKQIVSPIESLFCLSKVLRRTNRSAGFLFAVPIHHASSQPMLYHAATETFWQREVRVTFPTMLSFFTTNTRTCSACVAWIQKTSSKRHREIILWKPL